MIIISIFIWSIAFALKGGQGKKFFRNWKDNNPFSEKLTSTIFLAICLSFITVFYEINLGISEYSALSILYTLIAWWVAIAPSMGEEYGALMGRDYPVDSDDRKINTLRIFGKKFTWRNEIEYGVKKTFQRGVWMGAAMTCATGYIPFIWWSLLYAPVAALALNYAPSFPTIKNRYLGPWGLSEFAVGAACFGVPFSMMLAGMIG